jgi:hypothetical protein
VCVSFFRLCRLVPCRQDSLKQGQSVCGLHKNWQRWALSPQ